MDTQPLLQSLQDLIVTHEICIARTEELIDALANADPVRIRASVSTQRASLQAIDQVEMRRQLAVRGLTYSLSGGSPHGKTAVRDTLPVTFSSLLRVLSSEDAAPLVAARRTLLTAILRLQELQRRAALLAQTGQTVVGRTLRATFGVPDDRYGTAGDGVVLLHSLPAGQGRRA